MVRRGRTRWIEPSCVTGVALGLAFASACTTKHNPWWGRGEADSTGGTTTMSTDASASAGATSSVETSSSSSDPVGTDTEPTSSTGPEDSSTTEGPAFELCDGDALVEITFDALPLDADDWNTNVHDLVNGVVDEGALRVSIDWPDDTGGSVYWVAFGNPPLLRSGTVGLEVVQAPDPTYDAEVYIGLWDVANWWIYFAVTEGAIWAGHRDPEFDYHLSMTLDHDPLAHRWLRLVYDGPAEVIEFQVSADGATWSTVDELATPFLDFNNLFVEFGAGAWRGPVVEASLARVDNVFLCPPPL
jgi:hypothetical protein